MVVNSIVLIKTEDKIKSRLPNLIDAFRIFRDKHLRNDTCVCKDRLVDNVIIWNLTLEKLNRISDSQNSLLL